MFMTTFLKDQVTLWWRAYYQTIDWAATAPAWEEFTEAMKQQFIPVNIIIDAYDHLHHLSQKTLVSAYSHKF